MRKKAYPGLSRWAYSNHKDSYKSDRVTKKFEHVSLLALKMEGASKSRNTGDLKQQEKAREWVLPWNLQKKCSPDNTLILGFLTSRTVKKYTCVVLTHYMCGHYLSNRKLVIVTYEVAFLPFYTVHGVIEAKILKCFAIPSSSGLHFVRSGNTMIHPSFVALTQHGL